VDYISLPFNSRPPATFPAPLIYTGWAFNYYLVGEPTISGDYNQNGAVDAGDYVVWRKTGGTEQEYNTWRANFGRTTSSGSGALLDSATTAVPEPTSPLMLLIGMIDVRSPIRDSAIISFNSETCHYSTPFLTHAERAENS
jgi:hypothetical protein